MRRLTRRYAMGAALAALVLPGHAAAGEGLVAVATNFAPIAEELGAAFGARTGHELRFTAGSTGKLYTQIVRGAPFDAFLAADAARPERLEREGRGTGRFTYGIGRLVLWSRDGEPSEDVLRAIDRLSIANPALAPYGVAAMETLTHYGRSGDDTPALVMGENAGQAAAMIATGNVRFGLVPLAVTKTRAGGAAWTVPEDAHAPIRQDAILIDARNGAASAFLDFLRSDEAITIIEAGGYMVPDP